MLGDKLLFNHIEKYMGGAVTFGDGSQSKVIGKVTV
jgi:hypothetical protein